jgi:putative membrane protein
VDGMSFATTTLAQMSGRYGDNMDFNSGTSWIGMTIMIVLGVLVIGVIVWAIVYATRSTGHAPSNAHVASAAPSAREVLDNRYARGEIDTADYEERKSKLT